jgi:UDP-N-acetylmuramate dehydrogenase
MLVHNNASLQPFNTFGIAARARDLVIIESVQSLQEVLGSAWLAQQRANGRGVFVLGGGSNIVLSADVQAVVLKIEIGGCALVGETDKHWIVQAGAGVNWHDFVCWTVAQGWPGLENLALIPGVVGASPVQNIGAYGVELQDRFHALDAVDMYTGQTFSLNAGQCAFAYRDSVFKHPPAKALGQAGSGAAGGTPIARGAGLPYGLGMGLKGRAVITHVRFALPKAWRAELSYLDLQRQVEQTGITQPSAQQVLDWVVAIRRAKLPDPKVIGNAGSFFKNPTVTAYQCADIIGREPNLVHYPLADGRIKLAAGWLIDACGWRGKTIGLAGVYDKQALVLVNKGSADKPVTGGEVMTLAKAIQTSVFERFGIMLEPEPEVV